jgi:hypothetical protein
MRARLWLLLIPMLAALGCQASRDSLDRAPALTPAQRIAVQGQVRQFTIAVARDVTAQGPIAWTKYFADGPEFFMAVNGQLAFPNGAAAAQAIPQIAGAYKHIELRWGDDLRLDPLTENLCVVADSYAEVIELQPGAAGPQGTQTGYFTGLAENRNRHWQFRDAHWSAAVVPEKILAKK